MIEQGFFISKESLTPQEWKDFSSFADSLNMTEKEAALHLILKELESQKDLEKPIGFQLLKKSLDVLSKAKHKKLL
jgi:hypothetical protein